VLREIDFLLKQFGDGIKHSHLWRIVTSFMSGMQQRLEQI